MEKNIRHVDGYKHDVALRAVIELIHKTYRIKMCGTLTQLLMELGFSTLVTWVVSPETKK